ncbi:Hypothetical predicted protein [Podarcis lilfordi]|uniref:Uncharacterized protein n=1 Tax=Podarcis lilfordi TaxID=74358 RepID=A0AA35LJL5_9SAUR|nr:Hypothetical predicted protein [Podarcis lilfordi]
MRPHRRHLLKKKKGPGGGGEEQDLGMGRSLMASPRKMLGPKPMDSKLQERRFQLNIRMNFLTVKVKGPLTIRSSRDRLWGCSAHLALLAEGAGVQLPGHVASTTKPLLANQSSARKRRLPSHRSGRKGKKTEEKCG